MIRYHIVASLDISYCAIACSRAYLVILISCLWLRLIKHSGKEEESPKKVKKEREAFKKEKDDHKLISKRDLSMKIDTCA